VGDACTDQLPSRRAKASAKLRLLVSREQNFRPKTVGGEVTCPPHSSSLHALTVRAALVLLAVFPSLDASCPTPSYLPMHLVVLCGCDTGKRLAV